MEQRNSIGKTLWDIGSPFLLYVILSMSLQDALALCLTPWLDEAEYLTWSLAAVNALEIPIFYRMYRTRQGSRSREIPERSWIPAVLGAVFLGRGFNLLLGLTPLPTLFLIFIGYKVGSVAGMILAVPAGIIVANMYQAGFFDTTMDSVRILVHGFNRFRRLTPEDKAEISEKKE